MELPKTLCTHCVKQTRCSMYRKDPEAMVTKCGRYEPTKEHMEFLQSMIRGGVLDHVPKDKLKRVFDSDRFASGAKAES